MEAEIIGPEDRGTTVVHLRQQGTNNVHSPRGKIVPTWPEEGLARVRAIGMDSADVLLNIAGPGGEPSPQR